MAYFVIYISYHNKINKQTNKMSGKNVYEGNRENDAPCKAL